MAARCFCPSLSPLMAFPLSSIDVLASQRNVSDLFSSRPEVPRLRANTTRGCSGPPNAASQLVLTRAVSGVLGVHGTIWAGHSSDLSNPPFKQDEIWPFMAVYLSYFPACLMVMMDEEGRAPAKTRWPRPPPESSGQDRDGRGNSCPMRR